NKLIGVEAKLGHANSADIDITNTEILRADTRGPCGDVIVDTVFVGHGKRTLLATAERGGKVTALIPRAGPEGVSSEASAKVLDATEWADDQAYGFNYKKLGSDAALDLEVSFPTSVKEGEHVEVKFATNKKAYLVVYYVDSEGKGDVLWPSE